MRYPSVKTLLQIGIDTGQAKTVRGLMRGDLDPETIPACESWVRQCYHRPSDDELIMCAIDGVLETHGVEALGEIESDEFGTPAIEYCNTGDSYGATVLRDNRTGRYFVSTWGDEAEKEGF